MTVAPRRRAPRPDAATAPDRLPLRLDRESRGFLVAEGGVDVFVRTPDGPRRPLLRLEAGEAMFGLAPLTGVVVLAVGGAGAQIGPLDPETEPAQRAAWRARLAEPLGAFGDEGPGPALRAWLRARAAADREALQSRRQRQALWTDRLVRGLGRLAGATGTAAPAIHRSDDPLLGACQAVAGALGARGMRRLDEAAREETFAAVRGIAHSAGLRARRVLLRPGWAKRDVGALLAWRGEARRPVALLRARKGYVIVEGASGARSTLDQATARTISPEAVCFYRMLPDRPLDGRALLRWAAPVAGPELRRALLAALGAALLGLAIPVLTGVVIDEAILPSDPGALLASAFALVAAALGGAGFLAMQSLAVLRLGAASDATLQAAVIDRMLKLPPDFFRTYSAGDLVDRFYGVEALRRALAGRVVGGLLAGAFCVLGFVLMAAIDARLAVAAVLAGLVQLAVTLGLSRRRLRFERGYAQASGQARGLVLQIIAAVGKLRVAAAESRALAQWLERFTGQIENFIGARRAAGALAAFSATFPVLATLGIFAMGASPHGGGAGRFLAFYAAFGQVMATLVALGAALSELIAVVPQVERLRPLLAAEVEGERFGGDAVELSGAVEMREVTFAYGSAQRPVLDGLSLAVRRGEFVALVGPSGGGKSTLLRLLLGFERPQAGALLYDGRPIESLDLLSLRRQIGVVLQDGKLVSGSLYENICGAAVLPQAQVWEAVRQAGLAADVEAMPMGLHTVVTEGASTISGGQRQRLLIARALVRRPRLLLFDEATSALDNPTQAAVSAALADLAVTRIVIAHRLSTVRDADRILVIDRGRVVQQGSFASLSRQPGLFAELARRQTF